MYARRVTPATEIQRHHGVAGKPKPVACFWGKTTKATYGVALKASFWPAPVERPATPSEEQMADSTRRYSPAEILAMDDREVAIHVSGGYGPGKRIAMIASIKDICADRTAPAPRTPFAAA